MGSPRQIFKKKILAASVAALAGVSVSAIAQDAPPVEEVLVTGIRASLENAMDIKRESNGVVDAISAEDIGKFPDTNLAESLQRITGVSIDRSNGEGSKVTVRGLGPDFNMVTLNGRAMPAADAPLDSAAGSRAFDFANLASESVSGVEVYKTSRADIASGGMGATINIKTARPLDNPGLKAAAGVKLLHDTTSEAGSDLTPEVSGIFSWTDDDDKFGVAVTGSVQQRDSGSVGAYVNQWGLNEWDAKSAGSASVVNAPKIGQFYSIPTDLRYTVSDNERTRVNGQLTLQFAPTDSFETTFDATYSSNEYSESRGESSVWFTGDRELMVFDNNFVSTPIVYSEDQAGSTDLSFAQQEFAQKNENVSVGFNAKWQATDSFSLEFDAHSSTAESNPDASTGSFGNFSLASNIIGAQTVIWNDSLPIFQIEVDDFNASGPDVEDNWGQGNANGVLDRPDITTTRGTAHHSQVETTINQVRLNGSVDLDIDFADEFTVDFGVESRMMENTNIYARNDVIFGDWGGADPGIFPDELLTEINIADRFDDYDTTGIFSKAYDADFGALAQWGAARQAEGVGSFSGFIDGQFKPNLNELDENRTIEEEVVAFFVQGDMKFEIAERPATLAIGIRYEDTTVTSTSDLKLPSQIEWQDGDDFQVNFRDQDTLLAGEGSYDHVLPSIDFGIEIMTDVQARISYSESIARPTYNDLSAGYSNWDGKTQTTSTGDPSLLPFESSNIDLSVEWYYDDASYASVGYFRKNVDNFIGSGQFEDNLSGVLGEVLRDATAGPRAEAAAASLPADAAIEAIYDAVLVSEGKDPSIESTSVFPNAADPEIVWGVNRPVNSDNTVIDGLELAVQHMFGESGFGIQANYTVVDADVEFDVFSQGIQFAIEGLSDTANLVAFYDNNGLQARIAYNWRDKFLDTSNQFNNEPSFTEAYQQVDANVSYEFSDQLTVFVEGINLTEENLRRHGRTNVQLWELRDLGARYTLGARYSF